MSGHDLAEVTSPVDVVLTAEEIRSQVRELGSRISRDYVGRNPVVVGVLRGAFVFIADLARELTIPCEIDFMQVSSYGNGRASSGAVTLEQQPGTDLAGRHVIVVDDIVDSAITLKELIRLLRELGAESVEACVLLRKHRSDVTAHDVKYLGFEVPDRFLVGYGMDAAQKFRHLPFVGVAPDSV